MTIKKYKEGMTLLECIQIERNRLEDLTERMGENSLEQKHQALGRTPEQLADETISQVPGRIQAAVRMGLEDICLCPLGNADPRNIDGIGGAAGLIRDYFAGLGMGDLLFIGHGKPYYYSRYALRLKLPSV